MEVIALCGLSDGRVGQATGPKTMTALGERSATLNNHSLARQLAAE